MKYDKNLSLIGQNRERRMRGAEFRFFGFSVIENLSLKTHCKSLIFLFVAVLFGTANRKHLLWNIFRTWRILRQEKPRKWTRSRITERLPEFLRKERFRLDTIHTNISDWT